MDDDDGPDWQMQEEVLEQLYWFEQQGVQREDKRIANQNLKGFARRANGDQFCFEGCDKPALQEQVCGPASRD
jgi:hypothetical protein